MMMRHCVFFVTHTTTTDPENLLEDRRVCKSKSGKKTSPWIVASSLLHLLLTHTRRMIPAVKNFVLSTIYSFLEALCYQISIQRRKQQPVLWASNMNHPPPVASDLVLIGGGHAHVHVLKMFGMPQTRRLLWQSGIRVTLIAKDVHTPYSGMLPGYVAGHYAMEDIHLDLNQICKFSNIRLVHAACTKITYNNDNDNDNHQGGGGGGFCFLQDDRPPIRFDA